MLLTVVAPADGVTINPANDRPKLSHLEKSFPSNAEVGPSPPVFVFPGRFRLLSMPIMKSVGDRIFTCALAMTGPSRGMASDNRTTRELFIEDGLKDPWRVP